MSIQEEANRWESIFDAMMPVLVCFGGGLIMFLGGYTGYDIDWSNPVQIVGGLTSVIGAVLFGIRMFKIILNWLKKMFKKQG